MMRYEVPVVGICHRVTRGMCLAASAVAGSCGLRKYYSSRKEKQRENKVMAKEKKKEKAKK